MRIQWLINVQSLLFEHLENHCRHFTIFSLKIIVLNFFRLFRNHSNEFLFDQFAFTFYLRYLLEQYPVQSFEHSDYEQLMNNLFDLLFDFINLDLCEKVNYRCSILNDDYFHNLQIEQKNSFDRIKFVVYFIELIEIHRRKYFFDEKTNKFTFQK